VLFPLEVLAPDASVNVSAESVRDASNQVASIEEY